MTREELDQLIRAVLVAFAEDLGSHEWFGRENELINLFVFGHLLKLGYPPRGVMDPAQIGIEVAVPQLSDWSERSRQDVRKDVVIWSTPGVTCWSGPRQHAEPPLAILEWKSLNNVGVKERPVQKRREYERDVDWLVRTTPRFDGMIGYAIFGDLASPAITIDCQMVRNSAAGSEDQWTLSQ